MSDIDPEVFEDALLNYTNANFTFSSLLPTEGESSPSLMEQSITLVTALYDFKTTYGHGHIIIGAAGGGTFFNGQDIVIDRADLDKVGSTISTGKFLTELAHELGHATLPG